MENEVAPPLSGGRYRLLEVLGAGGMARVYKSFDRRLEVYRAIKVLSPAYAAHPEIRKRFLTEARTTAKLMHPNIVMAHDVGADGDRLFIVMELVEGGSIWDRMRDSGPLSAVASLEVMQALLPALQFAHDQGVIHRDIKPGNILTTRDAVCKLADFGIARVERIDDGMTRTGALLGTPAYMAPEQWNGSRELDARADLFAMGATLYSLVTLQTPQDLHIPEAAEEQLRPLPEAIKTVIQGVARYRPADRYPSATDMLEAVNSAHHRLLFGSGNGGPLFPGFSTPSSERAGSGRAAVGAALAGGLKARSSLLPVDAPPPPPRPPSAEPQVVTPNLVQLFAHTPAPLTPPEAPPPGALPRTPPPAPTSPVAASRPLMFQSVDTGADPAAVVVVPESPPGGPVTDPMLMGQSANRRPRQATGPVTPTDGTATRKPRAAPGPTTPTDPLRRSRSAGSPVTPTEGAHRARMPPGPTTPTDPSFARKQGGGSGSSAVLQVPLSRPNSGTGRAARDVPVGRVLLIGLLVGAAALGLTWALLSSSDDGAAVEQTHIVAPLPVGSGAPVAEPALPPGTPTGTLIVECRPDCPVYIGGRVRGSGRVELTLGTGSHAITLGQVGNRLNLQLEVARGETTSFCYDFSRRERCAP